MPRRARQAAVLFRAHGADLARAATWILTFRAALALLPLPLTLRLARVGPRRRRSAPSPRRIARIVDLMAWRMGRQACLVRSLALVRLLRQSGHEADVVLGTSLDGGRFAAHAWVQTRGSAALAEHDGGHAALCLLDPTP